MNIARVNNTGLHFFFLLCFTLSISMKLQAMYTDKSADSHQDTISANALRFAPISLVAQEHISQPMPFGKHIPGLFNDPQFNRIPHYQIILHDFNNDASPTIFVIVNKSTIKDYLKCYQEDAQLTNNAIHIKSHAEEVSPHMMASLMEIVFFTLYYYNKENLIREKLNDLFHQFENKKLTKPERSILLASTLGNIIKEDFVSYSKIINLLFSPPGSTEYCFENCNPYGNDDAVLNELEQYSAMLDYDTNIKLRDFLKLKIIHTLIDRKAYAHSNGKIELGQFEEKFSSLLEKYTKHSSGAGVLLVVHENHYDKDGNPCTPEIKWLLELFKLLGLKDVRVHHSKEIPLLKYYRQCYLFIDNHFIEDKDYNLVESLYHHFSYNCSSCNEQTTISCPNTQKSRMIPILILKKDQEQINIPTTLSPIINGTLHYPSPHSNCLKIIHRCINISGVIPPFSLKSNKDYQDISQQLEHYINGVESK